MIRRASFFIFSFVSLACGGAQAAQFAGTGTGPIPDAGTTGTYGTPLTVSFTVSGLSGPVTSVGLRAAMSHTWIDDLDVELFAPGGAPSLKIFSRVGNTTASPPGSATANTGCQTDLGGTYDFADGQSGSFWAGAGFLTSQSECLDASGITVPSGGYRTSAPGGVGSTGQATSLNAIFGGLSAAQANGTWTLVARDRGLQDEGDISSATLFINESLPVSLQRFSVD
ncbi:hypothetical protein [Tahibacter harae]|uniref:P/Homo B domain-containing protein n=1 Tax=Tahibacter harae TaxID=2963937 RepID=A0ABT1QTG3_9GAMM|nr:hypothetical protein [Tahibacter harae]MCQ4165561.1 hypothetical protein [Tahibacter harae]